MKAFEPYNYTKQSLGSLEPRRSLVWISIKRLIPFHAMKIRKNPTRSPIRAFPVRKEFPNLNKMEFQIKITTAMQTS
jgi:hypothetical protein